MVVLEELGAEELVGAAEDDEDFETLDVLAEDADFETLDEVAEDTDEDFETLDEVVLLTLVPNVVL